MSAIKVGAVGRTTTAVARGVWIAITIRKAMPARVAVWMALVQSRHVGGGIILWRLAAWQNASQTMMSIAVYPIRRMSKIVRSLGMLRKG